MKNKNTEKIVANALAFLIFSIGLAVVILSFAALTETIKKIEIYTK
jgi:hypothetical protein